MCWSTGSYTRGRLPIRFRTYNIWNRRNGGPESDLRGMYQANMDLGISQETKVTDGIYTLGSSGYSVVAMDAPIRNCGGVAVFYRLSPYFAVEAVQKFEPKVFGFQLATVERWWYIVGCYLSPDNILMIDSVVSALKERPRGYGMLVVGDFNAKLLEPKGDRRGEEIT